MATVYDGVAFVVISLRKQLTLVPIHKFDFLQVQRAHSWAALRLNNNDFFLYFWPGQLKDSAVLISR